MKKLRTAVLTGVVALVVVSMQYGITMASESNYQAPWAVEMFTLRQVPHHKGEYVWVCGDGTVYALRAQADDRSGTIRGLAGNDKMTTVRVPIAVAEWYTVHPKMLQVADYLFWESSSKIQDEVPPGRPKVGTRIWYVDGHYTTKNMTGYGPAVTKGYRLPKGAPVGLGESMPFNLTIPPATWSSEAEIRWCQSIIKTFHRKQTNMVSLVVHGKNGWVYFVSELDGEVNSYLTNSIITINHVEFYSETRAGQYFMKHGGSANEWNNVIVPAFYQYQAGN